MAQLKDLIVNGATRLIGDVFTNKIQITAVNAPTASNSTTYGPGTSGQVLKSNGTSVYWAADDNSQTVTGVKGNSESSYRTGNVNITAANIGLGNVENTKLSTWAGSTNITTLGTIDTGTWNGTTITAAHGGTGKTNLKDAANALINALDTGSSNLTANDYVITQYVGGGSTTTTYHRRPASALRVGGVLVTSTDEGIARYNGTTGALQNTSQITINDNGLLTATHTNGKTDGIAIKYSSTIDYFLGVGTANVNHGLYDNKAGKWVLSAGADNIWSLAGNAATATTASSVALSGVTGADDLKAIEALTGTTGILKKTAANTWTLDTTAYTTNTGTVTKVTAGTGLSIGTTAQGNFTTTGTINHTNSVTAQTTQALYPIKIDAQGHISAYGTAVTSLPASDVSAWAKAASKPSYALSEIAGADDVKAIEALTGTTGILKKTAANTWTLDTTAYTTNTGTVTKVTAGTGLNTSADQADSATKGSITTTGTLHLTKSGATAGSYGPSAAVTGSHGTTMNVPYVTVDAYGRVTSISNKVYTAQDTWRGIQDNLTSSTNTTESLSAKQGYLLANGDARDDTKLPLTGGTLSGSLWSGTTSDTVERQVGVASGAGTIYMYAHSGSTGNRGIYTQNAAGTYANVITVDQNNKVTLYGNAATATKLATPRTLWGQSFDGSANITGNLISPTTASSWLDGLRYTQGAYNVGDANNSSSYWPWMRQTNTNSATWFSFGTRGTKFYWIGSSTSRTENGYDYDMNFDVSAGRLYANIFSTSRRGTGTPSGGVDGDVYFQYS